MQIYHRLAAAFGLSEFIIIPGEIRGAGGFPIRDALPAPPFYLSRNLGAHASSVSLHSAHHLPDQGPLP